MVVVSDSWVKNVATFPTPAMNDIEMLITNNETKMTAKAELICRQNSHPFQDRTLTLDEPIKVGRSVARARAKPNNAIFDCKVLSRNHAMLWYENGKFYLQDTKSSNGTFVNTHKLTPDSEHHEVSSGDIVQFGVDVVENNRKITHGCIIATLRLYLPDGTEAKASPSISENNRHGMVPLDELYRLNQIIQEASDREECLQKKLAKLQAMLQTAKAATSTCWATYVGEERLLSRIATLETQLSQANKNWTEDRCKQELTKIQDENVAYQVAAIEALEKLHTEKLDAVAYVTELEIKETNVQQTASLAKMQVDTLQKELNDLLEKLIEEQKHSDNMRIEYEAKIQELQAQLDIKEEKLSTLEIKIDAKTNNKTIEEMSDIDFQKMKVTCNETNFSELKSIMESPSKETIQNHITLTMGPEQNLTSNDYSSNSENEDNSLINTNDSQNLPCHESNNTLDTLVNDKEKTKKDVKFELPEDVEMNDSDDETEEKANKEESDEKKGKVLDDIDSKTLKYHFQTQNDLKRQIEELVQQCKAKQSKVDELQSTINEVNQSFSELQADNEVLKEELRIFKDDLEKSNKENRALKNEVDSLLAVREIGAGDANNDNTLEKEVESTENSKSDKLVSYDELVTVEEELVLLKERFSQVNEDKVRLHREMDALREQYNSVRNHSHNIIFWYIAPFVLIVLYLLFSKMFS